MSDVRWCFTHGDVVEYGDTDCRYVRENGGECADVRVLPKGDYVIDFSLPNGATLSVSLDDLLGQGVLRKVEG